MLQLLITQTIENFVTNLNLSFFNRNGASALFGWNTIRSNNNEIVITANEFDAMSVYQATNLPCVALPTGASLPQQVALLLQN